MGPTKTLWNYDRGKAWTSIITCSVVWLAAGVGTWFLVSSMFGDVGKVVSSMVPEAGQVDFSQRLIRTLILMITQLVLIIISEVEHLGKMHNPVGVDRYRWYNFPIIMTVVAFVVCPIASGISLTWGWPTVVALADVLLLFWVPRLLFKPWIG